MLCFYSYLYWTELGSIDLSVEARVARVRIAGTHAVSAVETLISTPLIQPNSLDLDLTNRRMYIAAAHIRGILVCDMEGKPTL